MVTRLLIEGLAHRRVDVCTVTYADRWLPENGCLRRRDVALFLKRLRSRFDYECGRDPELMSLPVDELKARSRLRFFIACEYGSRFGRPHAHVVVFGADRFCFVNGVAFTSLVQSSWAMGHVDWSGRGWCPEAAGYVASYVAKGMTYAGHPALKGRVPEFSVFPSAPGLGVPGLPIVLCDLLAGRDAREVISAEGDLPCVARVGGRDRFLGRFLLNKLRDVAGLSVREQFDDWVRLVEERRLAARDVYAEHLAELTFGDVDFVDWSLSRIGDRRVDA